MYFFVWNGYGREVFVGSNVKLNVLSKRGVMEVHDGFFKHKFELFFLFKNSSFVTHVQSDPFCMPTETVVTLL